MSVVIATNPDIIVNGGRLQEAILLQRAFKEQNVNAKIFAYSVGPDTPDFGATLGKDAEYVFGGAQWSVTAKYKGAPGFYADSKTYAARFTQRYGHAPSYQNAESSAMGLDVVTFFGLLKFDERGMNIFKPMVVNQIQKGASVTVWPSASQAVQPLYPTPEWGKR